MRRLAVVVGVIVTGMLLFFAEGKPIAAAPGFSAADFKGHYVGHFIGDGASQCIISFDANGTGTVHTYVHCDSGTESGPNPFSYSFPGLVASGLTAPNGYLVAYATESSAELSGLLSDRGRTFDFVIRSAGFSGAGAATIQ